MAYQLPLAQSLPGFNMAADHGTHRTSESTSGTAILAAFIPTFVSAVVYLGIFVVLRNRMPKHYAPRTFLGTVPQKDRTPSSHPSGKGWFHDFRTLRDRFVLLHSSLDAYLYLRFLKFIIAICLLGSCLVFPILLPINANGGGQASQLDRLSFSNVARNDYLWAHTVVATVFFLAVFALIARERLLLVGTRQAYLISGPQAERLSSRTVLFLNAPRDAMLSGNLQKYFGDHAERSWPVTDAGELEALVQRRSSAAFALEGSQVDLIKRVNKDQGRSANTTRDSENGVDGSRPIAKHQRPSVRHPPVFGTKQDAVTTGRQQVVDLSGKIDDCHSALSKDVAEQSAVFVSFKDQGAAHRAFETLSFKSAQVPIEDRYLNVRPKEVLWKNLAMPMSMRLSKASLGLVFVIAFTIFFSIPVGLIGSISNVKYLANQFEWLGFINNLPDWALGLISGLLPPAVVSWFVSYVPKLFRHIAKLSGEPTTPQAELKTQAWFFSFSVFQIFLVTTFSSGAAAVVAKIAKEPQSAPALLAESLPKASNFYLTYFLFQGLTSAASNVLNYSDLFEYLFYEHYWDKTPREKFTTWAQMKGISYGSLLPKFTNLFVIAIAYACIAPLVLGFATVGLFLYYLSYRYNLMYVCQSKIDTRGEAYKRALQQMTTGIYLAELSLIGLFSARRAPIQSLLMIVLLILTAVANLVLDRILRPLELYLGVDVWQDQEVPLLANEDGIDENDEAGLHNASHNRRLGLSNYLPRRQASGLSAFFDTFISSSRSEIRNWLASPSAREDDVTELSAEDLDKAYRNPVFNAKTPKLWLPRDKAGVSKSEIQENEEAGIPTTDDAAEIGEKGEVKYVTDFEHVPIWKEPQAI